MTPLFGHTRSVFARNYALLEPSGLVASSLPGWSGGVKTFVVISPAMGADFTQTHVRFEADGIGRGRADEMEISAYVVSGSVEVVLAKKKQKVEAGGFFFVPAEMSWEIRGKQGAELIIFTKEYEPLAGVKDPQPVFGRADQVPGQAFLGDPDARLQVLLPDEPPFDLAMNIFTYQPGATLPMVETHIMEHGLVMLSGQGIYRLHDEWFPVRAGDVIWMGPYCPQWFVAMGKEPASYLYYKDVNRSAL